MQAAVYRAYGTWENLSLEEVDKPSPGPGEVRVRVHAVAVNDWDWQMLIGTPWVNRALNGWRKPRRTILGLDVAGRVDAVGAGVTKFTPGDAVYGDISDSFGGFAEYACAKESQWSSMPAGMPFPVAAATSHAGNLAVQGLIDAGRIRPGEKVLINGAGGGVGSIGLQIAKLQGCEVTGVDHGDKLEALRESGFDHVLDYRKTDFTRTGIRYDLILDTKTQKTASDYARALTPEGRYVTVGGDLDKLFFGVLIQGLFRSLAGRKRYRVVALKPNKDCGYLNELFAAGKLNPLLDGPHPFSDLVSQMKRYAEGKQKGRIVVEFDV
jgi:NADPH:quinone reductase-like Zn-dependent oxidoreductase